MGEPGVGLAAIGLTFLAMVLAIRAIERKDIYNLVFWMIVWHAGIMISIYMQSQGS